jgi:hypothetical protein
MNAPRNRRAITIVDVLDVLLIILIAIVVGLFYFR